MKTVAVFEKLYNLTPLARINSIAMSMFTKSSHASNKLFDKPFNGNSLECQASIRSIIESEIIPRLLKSERIDTSHGSKARPLRPLPTDAEVETFVNLCIASDPQSGQAFVDRMLQEGLNTEHIFLDLITPAARYMGKQWETDGMDFSQVTYGLVRLQAIAHAVGFAFQDGPIIRGEVKRAMIASAPGSEHILGATIVAEFFRKDGWQVVVEISPSAQELVQAARHEWFDTIGLSVSIEQQLRGLGQLVHKIKSESRNPRVAVLLGGPIFTTQELQAATFGAGAICTNAKEAVALALSLQPND
jgi:methanogenic corrinoid protein MtbC1